MSTLGKWGGGLVVLLAVATGTFLARRGSTQPAGDPKGGAPVRSVPVAAAVATTGDIGVYLNGLGSVVPLQTVTVRSRVDGELMSVLFREGQAVHRGDLLAEIDPRPFEVKRTQAQGQMARDQALLTNAMLDRQRYRTLLEQDSIAKQQLDTQESLVRQYEGAVKLDQGQVDDADLQLSYCHIKSPIDGRLGLRLVDPGNIVHASDTGGLVVITQVQPIAIVFTIAEDSLPPLLTKLNAGATLPVTAYDREQRHQLASGLLLTVDNQIDANTGTVRLKAQFPNDDSALFPNQFVNARLLIDLKRGSTLIPSVALQQGTQGNFVYVVKSDLTVEMRSVHVDVIEGEQAAIDKGLAAGERVVSDGADGLRDGSKVELPAENAAPRDHA